MDPRVASLGTGVTISASAIAGDGPPVMAEPLGVRKVLSRPAAGLPGVAKLERVVTRCPLPVEKTLPVVAIFSSCPVREIQVVSICRICVVKPRVDSASRRGDVAILSSYVTWNPIFVTVPFTQSRTSPRLVTGTACGKRRGEGTVGKLSSEVAPEEAREAQELTQATRSSRFVTGREDFVASNLSCGTEPAPSYRP